MLEGSANMNMDANNCETPVEEMVGKKKQSFGRWLAKVMVSAAVIGILAGGSILVVHKVRSGHKNDTTIETVNVEQVGKDYRGVSQIVENVKPAIVAISSTSQAVSYDLLGRPHVQKAAAAGSGFIIGQSGDEVLIATNNHVVQDATDIVIQFNDDTTATGVVKGTESASDLAVVSIDIHSLSKDTISNIRIATLGDSRVCQQGELVVAIGNALGYGQSTTVGYISALDRETVINDINLSLIQTDAAINPGNSGGALLNAKGEVIGINSVKCVETAVEGIGYAIPISQAVPILNDLMNRQNLRESQKADLGVSGKEVTEQDAAILGLPVGIYINRVDAGSAAARAGIKERDIITGVKGRTIETNQELEEFLDYTRGGTKVTLQVSVHENGAYVEKEFEVVLDYR